MFFFVIEFLLFVDVVVSLPVCKKVTELQVKNPAYIKLATIESTSEMVFFISSFSFTNQRVFAIRDFEEVITNPANFSNVEIQEYADDGTLNWPNGKTYCPRTVCGREGLLINDGFLVPLKSTGNVFFVPFEAGGIGLNESFLRTFEDIKDNFYHKTVLFDLTGNGKQEIITARCHASAETKKGQGTMVIRDGFNETIITFDGPETNFYVTDKCSIFRNPVILAPEFFQNKLSLYSASDWTDTSTILEHTIDEDNGQPFDSQFVEVFGDGRMFIITTMQNQGKPGYVYGYDFDEEFNSWNRNLIAGPFNCSGSNHGTPGVFTTIKFANKKRPSLVLSGDDGGNFYLLTPKDDESTSSWEYMVQVIVAVKGTVGPIVPFYDGKMIPYLLMSDFTQDKILLYQCQYE